MKASSVGEKRIECTLRVAGLATAGLLLWRSTQPCYVRLDRVEMSHGENVRIVNGVEWSLKHPLYPVRRADDQLVHQDSSGIYHYKAIDMQDSEVSYEETSSRYQIRKGLNNFYALKGLNSATLRLIFINNQNGKRTWGRDPEKDEPMSSKLQDNIYANDTVEPAAIAGHELYKAGKNYEWQSDATNSLYQAMIDSGATTVDVIETGYHGSTKTAFTPEGKVIFANGEKTFTHRDKTVWQAESTLPIALLGIFFGALATAPYSLFFFAYCLHVLSCTGRKFEL